MMSAVEPTERHQRCKHACIEAFKADQITFWESIAILSQVFGQGAAFSSIDPQDAIAAIYRNFEAGYNNTLDTTGMLIQ